MKILKFFSPFCGPCKVLDKNLKSSGVSYTSVDITSEEGEPLVETYSVKAVPTLIITDDEGKELMRNVGIMSPENIKNLIEKWE